MKKHKLEIVIKPGCPNRDTISIEAGVVSATVDVFVKQHDTYSRSGADLLMQKTISPQQSSFDFETLDNRILTVKSLRLSQDQLNDSSALLWVPKEGMPFFGDHEKRGDLYIKISLDSSQNGEDPTFSGVFDGAPGNADQSSGILTDECSEELSNLSLKYEVLSLDDNTKDEAFSLETFI